MIVCAIEKAARSLGMRLLPGLLLFVTAMAVAQTRSDGTITMKFENKAMGVALKTFGDVAGVKVNFSTTDVSPYSVTADIRNATPQKALDRILSGTPLKADWQGKIVTVAKKKSAVREADNVKNKPIDFRTIKGRVLDDEKISVPGANVRTPDGKYGTITSARGDFEIKVPENTDRIEISFVGMKPETVNVGGRDYVDVVLHDDQQLLDEVVVTGYQTIEKGRATGAFSLVDKDDIDNLYSTDIKQRLEGAAPGLYVNNNNQLEIRGTCSLYANTAPLIVVDGFPMESSTLNLNPNDIEQISVLKDAASASIWGIRAANGVIVITTRRGAHKKDLDISYSGTVSWTQRPDLNDMHILSSKEYAAASFDRYLATGFTTNGVYGGYDEIQETYLNFKNGLINEQDARSRIAGIGSFDNRDQLNSLFYRRALTQQHNLTFRVGGERYSSYVSLNYDYSRGAQAGNNNHKFNLLLNNDFTISPTVSLQLNVRSTMQEGKNNSVQVLYFEPWQRVLNDDGSLYSSYTNPYLSVSPVYREKCEALGMKDWSYNPLQELRDNDNTIKELNLAASARLAWKPIKGLELASQFSYEYGRSDLESLYSENHFFTRNLVNQFTQVTIGSDGYPTEIVDHHIPTAGGIKDITSGRSHSYVFRNTASYNFNVSDFDFKAMAGNEIYTYETNSAYHRQWGYQDDLLSVQSVDEASLQSGVKGYNGRTNVLNYAPNIGAGLERYVSWFGTFSATYKGNYDLFGSLRLDQTNLLTNASKYRNNPAWSVGGKWNISNESFVRIPNLDYLSMRASYGLSGNIDKSTSPDMVVRAGNGVAIRSLNILYVTNPANPQLGWEKTNTLNWGLDFSFFNGKLFGSVDLYQKRSSDLLALVQTLDPTTGWTSFYKNSASMVNRGIDLALHGCVLQRQNLRWDVNLNLSYNYNKVNKLLFTPTASSMLGYGSSFMDGEPSSVLTAIRYGGLDDNGEPTFMKKDDDTRYSWTELSTLSLDDLVVAGRTTPPVFGSLGTSLKYNDFTFSVMFTYKFGHKMRLPSTTTNNLWTEWFGSNYRWIEGEDNTGKWVPRMYTSSIIAPTNYNSCLSNSDKLIDNADVIRLRSVSVEYDLNTFFRKLTFNGGRLRFSAENIWFWASNRYNLDPDQIQPTSGSISLPVKPTFVASLNITL